MRRMGAISADGINCAAVKYGMRRWPLFWEATEQESGM